MPRNNGLIEDSDLVKVEDTLRIVKRTDLIDRYFQFSRYSDLLFDVMNENGDIIINSNSQEPVFSSLHLLKSDRQTTRAKVAILLGKYAEAIMVMNCNGDDRFNRHFARIARGGQKRATTNNFLNNFTAISTGSHKTKREFRRHYQYSESQRDIVWVDNRDVGALLTRPRTRGDIAGIQLKVSYDWKNLKNSLTQYYYPILYFSMNDDWNDLNDYINQKKNDGFQDFDHVNLVPIDDYSNDVLETLEYFEYLLTELINGELSISYLIEQAKAEHKSAIGHAITGLFYTEDEILLTASALRAVEREEEWRRQREEMRNTNLRDLLNSSRR